MVRYDALILGAGAAGLAAARRLTDEGMEVAVVEARSRVGGRLWTERVSGLAIPLELGAEFVHGEPPRLRELAGEAGTRLIEGPDAHGEEFWERLEGVLGRLRSPAAHDQSLRDALLERGLWPRGPSAPRDPREREAAELAISFVEGFDAADPEVISAKSLTDAGGFDRAAYRVEGGYASLLKPLLTPAVSRSLRLGTAVTAVHWTRGGVRFRCQTRSGVPLPQLAGGRALFTLPSGVWLARAGVPGSVRFFPELAAKRELATFLPMGPVVKLVLAFRARVWDARLGFAHDLERLTALPTWWSAAPAEAPVLTGWAGGPAAARLAGRSKEELVSLGLESLGRVLGRAPSELRRELTGAYSHDWQLDPYSRGGYSYARVGGARAPRVFARPVEETLFFAGEALAPEGRNGTVDGAIASGERAAEELLDVTRRARWLPRAAGG